MNKTSVKLLLVEVIDSSREGMGKPWSRGTNSHLLFTVNATLNLSNVPFLHQRVFLIFRLSYMGQTTVLGKKTVQIPSPQKEKKMGEKFFMLSHYKEIYY